MLNSEQEEAINECHSVFLVACPGSGKTRTLTHKIATELCKVESDRKFIIAITYTNRAADEIHERIASLGVDTSQLWIGTIHAFCIEWILRPYGIYHQSLSHGFSLIDPYDRNEILSELCGRYEKQKPKITPWDCRFYCTTKGLILSCSDEFKQQRIQRILEEYFEYLRESRLIDFEQVLYFSYQLILTKPSISNILSQMFSYIMVDEYQDTKEIQYSIIASILSAGQGTKTFIVGDPNQAIYESLGGYAMTCEEFREMAGIEIRKLSLSKNYRSSERIINFFSNYKAFNTRIEAVSKEKCYPSLITHNKSITKNQLEEILVHIIRLNIETMEIAPNEICILAPQWAHLANMTRRLIEMMPEYDFDGPGMVPFASNRDNFWFKLAKIALTDPSPEMFVKRHRWAQDVLRDLSEAGVDITLLTAKRLLRECNAISINETDGLSYLRYFFKGLFTNLSINFNSFTQLNEHYTAFFNASEKRIEQQRNNGGLVGDTASFKKVFQTRTGITLSTIHGIKGAEFDTVIAFGLLEGLLPYKDDPHKDLSAKKLIYVVGSRARKNLHLISERGRRVGRTKVEYQPTQMLLEHQFDYDNISCNR